MKRPIDAPIPGENYTSDTKNYPWHRPPEKTDLTDIVGSAIEKMSRPTQSSIILSGLEAGGTVLDFVSYSLLSGIGKGKIPVDQAILAAGPIARYIEAMAKAEGIEYERGWEQEPEMVTKTDIQVMTGQLPKDRKPENSEPVEDTQPAMPTGGLMGVAPEDDEPAAEDEQMAMLGYGG